MGAAENTLLLFLSDNGGDPNGRNAPYRGLKSSVFEGGIRVPCAMRWPGRIAAGGTVGQVSLTMDLLPTIAAATGVRVPAGRRLDGIDLLPFVRDGRAAVARTVFWRYKRGKARRKAVREGDWKYIDDSGKQYLFDLAGDEQEKRDLLAERPEVAARLRSLLARWEEDVRAPRLAGFSTP
jgi:arylsulfatase A-like enzyme